MAKIGIVTVLYNSENVLEDFFHSLENQTFKDFVLYIIDNASRDKGYNLACKLAQEVSFKCIFFCEKTNWGIAKGNNIGIEAALDDGVEYVLLSNNDIILKPNAIEELLKGLQSTNSTLAVPKIYYSGTNIIWQAGGRFNLLKATTPHNGNLILDNGQFEKIKEYDYSSTCFMLIKQDVFRRVGLMDEEYFVYYDDSDFIYRCTRIGREKLIYIPSSIVEHKVSVSTQKGSDFYNRMMFRNRVLFIKKNYNIINKYRSISCLLLYHLIIHPFKMSKHEFYITSKALLEGLKMNSNEG